MAFLINRYKKITNQFIHIIDYTQLNSTTINPLQADFTLLTENAPRVHCNCHTVYSKNSKPTEMKVSNNTEKY